jgi:hypothetical protein
VSLVKRRASVYRAAVIINTLVMADNTYVSTKLITESTFRSVSILADVAYFSSDTLVHILTPSRLPSAAEFKLMFGVC